MASVDAITGSQRRHLLVERADALVPVLRDRAALTEQLRRLPAETVADLRAAELVQIAAPAQYGGGGLDVDSVFAVAAELGRGCGSTGWCYGVWAAHTWWLGHFPELGQSEFFATGPGTLVSCGLNAANGVANGVPGGFRVSGRWTFATGCDWADWIMVAGAVADGERRWLLVPRVDCEIIDTWFAAGLRGSGSKDVAVDEVFVPTHRTIDPDRAGVDDTTGWELHGLTSYRAPLKVLMEWAVAAPLIGIAQGVVEAFAARLTNGATATAAGVPAQLRLAEASARVDTARALHRARVVELLDRASDGGTFSPLVRARSLRDSAFTVKLCVDAANLLYEASGARAIMDNEALQRLTRDVQAASHHALLNWDAAAVEFGRQALLASSATPTGDGPELSTAAERRPRSPTGVTT